MKLILFLLILVFALNLTYDYAADVTQEVIAKNSAKSWSPLAQSIFASVSYFMHQNRVAREAYSMQIKLFPEEADRDKAYYRIARASERLSDYAVAAKYYHLYLKGFPKSNKAKQVIGRLADIEDVYLEFAR